MKKNYFSLFLAMTMSAVSVFAQQKAPCATDEVRKKLIASHPEILKLEEDFNRQVATGLGKIDFSKVAKTTDTTLPDDFWYDIPIVVHVIHDYGQEWLSDDVIFQDLVQWNIVYAKQNADTADVIAPFKKWIGNPHIRLHLATKDRFGNPTKGITRHRSYLTYGDNDQAKLDDWPNTSYVNIWFVAALSATGGISPAAYAYFPSTGEALPFWDGVICLSSYAVTDKTINHEMGHVMSLLHVWGNNNNATEGTCADGGTDYVDDTPPTIGHLDCTNVNDTECATGYYVIYPSVNNPGTDSLVDYPDTTNVQNIMDYSYCSKMFTKGQVVRMHQALWSSTASRNNLYSPFNLSITGALDPMPDLEPIPEFAATNSSSSISAPPMYFVGTSNHPNAKIKFINKSWNDTVSFVHWQFSNGAAIADTTIHGTVNNAVTNKFSQPGWLTVTMTVTDTSGQSVGRANNQTTTTFPNTVFVADSTGTDGNGYYQEFNPSGDVAKWPTFNYYNNEFKWTIDSTHGYWDHYCMKYTGFDTRIDPVDNVYNFTGSPGGDFDDLFSIPMDLSSFADGAPCYLNFMYSGASRSTNTLDVNDSMLIQSSVDGGNTWTTISTMKKNTLENKGSLSLAYAPSTPEDWAPMAISLPQDGRNLRGGYTVFRFRYFPGNSAESGLSSGNNFYLDRINFSSFPAEVNNVMPVDMQVTVVPNPTQGNAYVVVNNKNATSAKVIVSDLTGKVVFETTQALGSTGAKIEIPQSTILTKGMYLVQTVTGNNTNTNKLVVY